jgi:MoaA/NifB/PqqE/SkfB family radical SAM enzyme
MKLYVLPVEKACNASCQWCITDFRETAKKGLLAVADLEEKLAKLPTLDKIEITGGGEPLLHPQLDRIVRTCVLKAPTMIYTNGALLERKAPHLRGVYQIAISRAHYDNNENARIMDVDYNWETAVRACPASVKASLLLHKGGIETAEEVRHYLDWLHESGVRKAVIRQLFAHESQQYAVRFDDARVGTADIYRTLGGRDAPQGMQNPHLGWNGLDVEFELRTCACEIDNPVLHADGRLHKGWTQGTRRVILTGNEIGRQMPVAA